MKLSSLAVVVSDAKKSAQWYKEKLGLETRSGHGHWITVAPKDSNVEIHLCEEFFPLEPGNTGIAFTVEDAKEEEEILRKRGVEFSRPTTKEDWGTYAMFKDPDGNEFWLIQE
jgi:catechol 2,3-dioxygenase-like lactoylglutathione lyase family enzyme